LTTNDARDVLQEGLLDFHIGVLAALPAFELLASQQQHSWQQHSSNPKLPQWLAFMELLQFASYLQCVDNRLSVGEDLLTTRYFSGSRFCRQFRDVFDG